MPNRSTPETRGGTTNSGLDDADKIMIEQICALSQADQLRFIIGTQIQEAKIFGEILGELDAQTLLIRRILARSH
jgi:hypothetical protein